MTREEFRFLAAGQVAYQKRGGTLDFKEMDNFVEGALFGFDFAMRMTRKEPGFKLDQKQQIDTQKTVNLEQVNNNHPDVVRS